jgi:hypothetical protein
MYIPTTLAVLGLLSGLVILLRSFWWRLPERSRAPLLAIALVAASLPVLSMVTHWETTSARINALLHWTAVAGYELILMRFSLMRPRWLTTICAFILVLPIFGDAFLMPLAKLFEPDDAEVFAMEGPYLCERSPWPTIGNKIPGFNLRVLYRPRIAPFLRHRVQLSAFNSEQCVASASTASILPGAQQILFHCPARPGQAPVEHILPLK